MSEFMIRYKKMKGFERLVFHAGEEPEHEYYVETGTMKPWSKKSLITAQQKGLLTVAESFREQGIYFVKLTDAGKELRDKLLTTLRPDLP